MIPAELEFEACKFLRAPTVRVISALLGAVVPALAAALTVAATSDSVTPIALKASAMVIGTGWNGYLSTVGMVLSVAVLLGVGFVLSWSFGREFTDHTFSALFALPVSRRRLAYAKFIVVIAWSLLLCLVTILLALPLGLAIGLGPPDSAALSVGARILVTWSLTTLLACPLAWVASAARGYLAAVGALILVIVVTQVVTAFGGGAWFPYAAPGLWMGLGGPAASQVTPLQLLLAVPVGAAGVWVTGRWWKTAELTRR
ncbi:ABC transporter permease [Cryobacterium sp. PH31-L1]|uniref:ABC transporter permease n=1 Tax=Cryobacterium sp. PH31-L1 TaxID=3046199 RepID=UPI0024BAF216|nr:ABC transporter permease [Cryobacterium sp. PH31-L1]MDJ0376651.1 ABC transporter permease [Cryobacterium sp. PH31-L1]